MSPLHEHPQLIPLFNSTCRAIFERVARNPASAPTLSRELGLPPLEVSRLLCELVGAGLVVADRSAGLLVYRLDDSGMTSLFSRIEQAWARALARAFAGSLS